MVPDDPATEPAARRRRVIEAGHSGDLVGAREGLADPDPVVRAAALGALARLDALGDPELSDAVRDESAPVRRRACELAGARPQSSVLAEAMRDALGDPDPMVVEAACWAAGEHEDANATAALAALTAAHPDTRCREAAVAALGAIGDVRGLAALLGALSDKPTVRRRSAVALAAFDGPEVEAALERCLVDRDWQVRQVAEILLERPPT
jgi:HEAT repeat protein